VFFKPIEIQLNNIIDLYIDLIRLWPNWENAHYNGGIGMKLNKGRVEFECNDILLERGFYWAKATALSYVHEGDPVGDWYEAALPGRHAFCMRDVAHYSVGAQILGLDTHNKNMLKKFAQGISESRDFCSFWEITKDNLPVSGDYTSDKDFWYNLPANFDILQACWKMFLWTNDHDYLHAADFNVFYNATVDEYIHAWDKNNDGIPERAVPGSRRGIPSYEERDEYGYALMMSDLIALQALAFDSYASIHRMKGNDYLFEKYTQKALELRVFYDQKWWDKDNQRFSSAMFCDGKFNPPSDSDQDVSILPLYYGLIIDDAKLDRQLDRMKHCDSEFVEYLSYLPEVFYKYSLNEEAYQYILKLTDPKLKRREYPEISFAVIAAITAGIMGIEPHADKERIRTEAKLPASVKKARMDNIPIFGGEISVEQIGNKLIKFTNHTGGGVLWQPVFYYDTAEILVDGKVVVARHDKKQNGQVFSYVDITVENGYKARAEMSPSEGMV